MSIARALYAGLVRLHPPGFRQMFGAEMLRIFEEAVGEFGVAWLLWEAWLSMLRQWLLQPVEPAKSVVPVGAGLRSGVYPYVEPFELRVERLILAFVLTLLLLLPLRVAGSGSVPATHHAIGRR